jgi:hypothetical protein
LQNFFQGGKLVAVPRKKLPPDVIEFFRKQGSKGGKKAAASMTPKARIARAKKAAEAMTPEQRAARAKKASAAAAAARKVKKASE